ncbi:MAG: tRNA pseudouridine(55) synthase TruB [Candidatus Cloacimonetes bacterium]|nr:tRNA pseudouridine(55) synthase TruB [Candidatus Cloacimonadota bacterium]
MNSTASESSGFIAIDKPAGITSFDVIRRLRRITGIRKIGHCGTLDPFATGLLICCIGSYTRLAKYVESEEKAYYATIQLGAQSETGDTEGTIIKTADVPSQLIDPEQVQQTALSLSELPVPAYSAIKLNGTRAYTLARSGVEMDMPIRATKISVFQLIAWEDGSIINDVSQLSYRCTVSKGTYIRSLSEWLAQQIGTLGYTIQLRRESIGVTSIEKAVTLEALNPDNWKQSLISPRQVLSRLTSLELDDVQEKCISNGGDIAIPSDIQITNPTCALYNTTNKLLAIGEVSIDSIHPIIVLI